MTARLQRRTWPIIVSVIFVGLGLAYFFRWGPVGQHNPSLWISPTDLWFTYFAASQLAHGHLGAIYNSNAHFLEFPGILLVLAPLGALSNSFHTTILQVTKTQSLPALHFAASAPNIPFLNAEQFHFEGKTYVSHPQWVAAVDPCALLLSCVALFACDALAERLQVSRQRRVVLSVIEAVLLWNVTVWWGHPEDAVAVALAAYALIFALDGRFVGAGWLIGAAVAFQPLVLLMVPVLVAMAGRRSGLGVAIRAILPATVLLAAPLVANFRGTLHTLVDQPSSPNYDHATPWTTLSPNLGGRGTLLMVAAGPVRIVAILLAVGLGLWAARHWRERPERLVWACALALALRSYTESVMTDYYAWAALAVGVVVAARCSLRRFEMSIAVAIATTILAQWKLAWLPWWTIQIVGLTALLVVSMQPQPLVLAKPRIEPGRSRSPAESRRRSAPVTAGNKAPGRARSPVDTRSRSGSVTEKKAASGRARSPADPQLRSASVPRKKKR
jgi:hypothetical protein